MALSPAGVPIATEPAAAAARIAPALIAWYATHGRRGLPWQRERTPYRVWLSEIMLQQTQVATVLGYYPRFLQRFPSIEMLAAAPLDEVLHLWSGLGYYTRARHLHQAAQRVVQQHAGELPAQMELLLRLPGVGRSTAAAILALAYGRRAAILDGNVRRVLSRVFAVAGRPGEPASERILWRHAEQCTPHEQVAVYTQAIMDFGATVCTRARPRCASCPLRYQCLAYRTDRVQQLPSPRQRAPRPLQQTVLLLARRSDGAVLLRRRPLRGVWAGLWTPPQFDNLEQLARFCGAQLLAARLASQPLPTVRHRFTHFDLDIIPVEASCAGAASAVADGEDALWYRASAAAAIGLPTPIATLLRTLPPIIT